MKEILLTPVRFTPAIAAKLARRRLIRLLDPTPKIRSCTRRYGMLDMVYVSQPRYGSHALACIRCCWGNLALNSHPDNEEFIFFHPSPGQFRPLYMIIGMHRHDAMEARARSGKLSARDFLALEMSYNHPRLSIFTMLAGTLHCEFVPASRKPAPVFFASEPDRLPMRHFNAGDLRLTVKCR